MSEDNLPESLQESVLAALIFNEKAGAVISGQVLPKHFDENYREISERILAYRRKYGRPPGQAHLDDLFSKALAGGRDSRLRRTLFSLSSIAEGLNGDYLISRTQDFVREQTLKAALIEANSRYEQGGDDVATEVEAVLSKALRFRAQTMDAGVFLNDTTRSLGFLDHAEDGISLGIKDLDRAGVQLRPGEYILMIAPKGCLVGSTLVDCPRDLSTNPHGIPIKDLLGKQFYTYSWDFAQNKPCVSRVLDVWSSGRKPVYRVKLTAKLREKVGRKSGGSGRAKYLPPLEIVGTFDHPVLLSDGTWRKLGELQPKDSLMSLYRSVESSGGGYCNLRWTGGNKSVREHQFVCTGVWGAPPASGEVFHAHHKNENSYDNTPSNVEWKLGTKHAADHPAEANRQGRTGWRVSGVHPKGMRGKRHSEEVIERIRQSSIKAAALREKDSAGRFVKSPNHTVVSVEYVGVEETYDMEVEGVHNFVANGVFVHNSGKSWSCTHVGVEALLQQQKVLHISLEMPEDRVTGRYYQRLFGGAMKPDKFNKTVLEFDKLGRLSGFKTRQASPRMDFSTTSAKKDLRQRLKPWGTRLGKLVVKHFPSGSLTMQQLEGYIDYLEMQHKFVPRVLIIDYPDLMAQDSKDLRISLGRTFVNLRGLLDTRKMAGYFPTQGTRGTIKASKVKSGDVSEDISKVFTADNVLTYSQTAAEERLGLGRVSIAHARYGATGNTIILTQSYATGQYVLQSALMQQAYWEKLEELSDEGEVSDR